MSLISKKKSELKAVCFYINPLEIFFQYYKKNSKKLLFFLNSVRACLASGPKSGRWNSKREHTYLMSRLFARSSHLFYRLLTKTNYTLGGVEEFTEWWKHTCYAYPSFTDLDMFDSDNTWAIKCWTWLSGLRTDGGAECRCMSHVKVYYS